MTREEIDAAWAEVTRVVVFNPPTAPIEHDRESLLVETLRWWLQANIFDGMMRNSALGRRTITILEEYDRRRPA
jgi:hypothetical protein